MTVRMTTDEALLLIEELRAVRAADTADRDDARARALLVLSAARIANDDTALGDPERIINGEGQYQGLGSRSLGVLGRSAWFATLIEAVADADRFVEWRRRTAGQHHEASAALNECVGTAVDRAALAVGVLLYGSSGVTA